MPASCTVHVLDCATCVGGFRGQQCVIKSGSGQPSDYTGCWPPATAGAGTPQAPFVGWGFYSPGLACPTGYTAACTAQYGDRPGWDIEFTLIPGETAIGCCPQGFRCTNLNGNTCVAVASTGTHITVTTGMCSGSELVSVSQATFPDVIVITTSATDATNSASAAVQTVTREMTLLAPMFQLNYRSSDLATLGLSPSTSMSPSTGLNAATNSPSTPALAASGQAGLSTGAAVGIGVGAALGGILFATVVAWVWAKRRRQRPAGTTPEAVEPAGIGGAGEKSYPSSEYYAAHSWARPELEGYGGMAPVELPAGTPRNPRHFHNA
ncbi:hypothetical protein VTI74DRAFT_9479 [Chaetomium olivicolor]